MNFFNMQLVKTFFIKTSFLLLFVFPLLAHADSIVSYADLYFHSDLEKEEFLKLDEDNNPDWFALFLSADKSITREESNRYKEKINSILVSFQKKSFEKLKAKKKIKKVYDQIQDKLMDKYVETALFADLFKKGEYQCATSSMLFTRVFDKLDIPYEIEFEPGHVYLIAYPETERIMVQTTNPNKGVFVYDNGFKTNFIEYMRKNKLISKDEYENKSIDDLFTEYYLKTESGDLKQLAAVQYSNMAVLKLRDSKITESFQNMLKAYYLNPDNKNKFLLTLTLGMNMDKTGASDPKYAGYFVMIYKLTKNNLNKDLMLSIFSMITEKQYKAKGNLDLYNKSYQLITENITDSTLLNEISFSYNSELGVDYLTQSQPEKAREYIIKAFTLQPANTRAQSWLIELFEQQANTLNQNTALFEALNDSILDFYNRYEILKNNSRLVNLMYKMDLNLAGYHYYRGNIQKGELYKKKFEDLADHSGIDLTFKAKSLVERNYSSISVYYFKRNNIRKAKAVIKKALQYCPDSFVLKERYKALN